MVEAAGDVDVTDSTSGRRRVQWALQIYLAVFVGLNVYVWVWFALHRHGVHYFPLGERVERFGDLLRFTGKYQIGKDPRMVDSEHLVGTLFPKNYPAFGVVIYLFLLQVCAPYALFVMLGVMIGAVAVACTLLWRRVRRLDGYRWYMGAAIFATGLLGWGTEQVAMRANIEGVMWIFVCLGAALYAWRRYSGAAMAFGTACCLKPYPVLWLVLMVRHRRYREAALGVVMVGAVTLGSLLAIDRNPLQAYRSIGAPSNFYGTYIVAFRPMDEMMGDHSLLQTMKTLARVVRNHGLNFSYLEYWMHANDPLAAKLLYACIPLTVLIAAVVVWRVWSKPVLNQIFALACVTMVLPLVAGDYTLTQVLIPMGFFLLFLLEDVATGRVGMSLGQMLWFLLPCAWIAGTEPLGVLHGVLKCAALLVLLGASVTIRLPSTLFGEVGIPMRAS